MRRSARIDLCARPETIPDATATDLEAETVVSSTPLRAATSLDPYSLPLSAIIQKVSRGLPSITVDREIQGGAPVVRGTRIPVCSILRALENYGTLSAVIDCYPDLNMDHVKDAIYFARAILEPPIGINEVAMAP